MQQQLIRKTGIILGVTVKQRLLVLVAFLAIYSCNPNDSSEGRPATAKGNVVYGGSIKINGFEKHQSLYPMSIRDVGSFDVAYQIHAGLLKFNPRNIEEVMPSIAESWQIDDSGLNYRFNLNKAAKFHNDECFTGGEGRAITAQDIAYTFTLLCTKSDDNLNFNDTFKDKILGASEFYNGEANDVAGIIVVDDYTIEIQLEEPSTIFLYTLARPSTAIIPKEAVEKYGAKSTVGAGPYRYVGSNDEEENVTLARNENYFVVDSFGNQLPYLDTVLFLYKGSENAKMDAFANGELDYMNNITADRVKAFVSENSDDFMSSPPKFLLTIAPEMTTHYYQFNLTREVFKDKRVRQAFNYAVDRQRIVKKILKDEAYGFGNYGMTPPSFKDYDINQIDGYMFNPDTARLLLAQAGYKDGMGFPKVNLEVNSGGSRNFRVAFEVQKQLADVLGINLEIDFVTFGKKLEDAKNGNYDIVRSAWVADYPTPESFLSLFYGKFLPDPITDPSYPNTARYYNAEFDEFFEKGKRETDIAKQQAYFLQAEQVLMEDAPVIALWYSEDYRLIQSYVRNLYTNPINALDLTEVFLKERESEIKGIAD